MCHKQLILRTVSAALILLVGSLSVHSQRNTTTNISLAELERAVERGTPDDERRVADHAIANPNDPRALELLARLRYKQARISEAKALYQRVLTLDPTSISAKIMSARIALTSGQGNEAVQILRSINDSSSIDPNLKFDLASVLSLAGETERSISVAETLPANIKNSTALPLLAALYLRSGKADQFIALVPKMKKAAVLDPALAIACAEVLRNASRHDDAIGILTSVRNYQNDIRILVALSRIEIMRRDFTGAREHLRRASALKLDSVDVLSTQAFLEASGGALDNAFKLISRARDLAPDSSAVLADYVVIAMRNNKPTQALDAARTLTALDRSEPEFRYLFGAASLQSGDLDTAQAILEVYVKERPADSRGCLALGMTYAGRRDQIGKAREQLAHCFAIDPSNTEAKYQLALSYRSQGENKPAISLLEEVVHQDPANALALRDLGTLYFETGDTAKSRPLLEKAADVDPKDADTHFQLARLYNQIGETDLAKKQQELFRQLRGPWGKTSQ